MKYHECQTLEKNSRDDLQSIQGSAFAVQGLASFWCKVTPQSGETRQGVVGIQGETAKSTDGMRSTKIISQDHSKVTCVA